MIEWSPCWIWIGRRDRGGYGQICFAIRKRNVNRSAHRVSYFAHKGIKYRKNTPVLCHQCDNRACINPEHVDPGTQRKNVLDMLERGRHANMYGNQANNYGRGLIIDVSELQEEVEEVVDTVERQPGED